MTRVLVTGGTGFLGRALVERLLADGTQVRVLVRKPSQAQELLALGADPVIGDVTDRSATDRALSEVSVVYHLAGKLLQPGQPPDEYRRIHVEGTRNVLDACAGLSSLKRFVHCSTTGVLGTTGTAPAKEDAPFRPTNVYESTKAEAEIAVRTAIGEGLPATIVRPGLVYGPRDWHLENFFRSVLRRQFRPIGREDVFLHPVYIDDMTEAFIRCGSALEAVGECFHIAGAEPVSLQRLATSIASAGGVKPPSGRIPLIGARVVASLGDALPSRWRHLAPLTRSRLDFLTHSRVYDVSKAWDLLRFQATTDLESGVERTLAWYRAKQPSARVVPRGSVALVD